MDEKDLEQTPEEEFDLDSILSEFSGPEEAEADPETGESPDLNSILEDFPQEEELPAESPAGQDEKPEEVPAEEQPELSEAPEDAETEASEKGEETPEEETTAPADGAEKTIRVEDPAAEESQESPDGEGREEAAPSEDYQEPIPFVDPHARLRDLKKRLIAGPEKRYYDLSEMGTGKLQAAVLVNVILVLLCALGAVLFAGGHVPQNRMRLLIFSQVLAMLISGLMGLNLMIDGFSEIFHGRFRIETLVSLTFLACLADAFFCLRDQRVPCCGAFCLQMTFALLARIQSRNTEMGMMDTLRKAVRLHGLVRMPDFQDNQPAYVRSEGRLEDFLNEYQASSGPEKVQSFYAFFSFLICIAIAVLAGMLHGVSMALQIFAASLMVAVPASFFVALTRPAAILERRLHLVGSVICGWKGVKGLCSKAFFPLRDKDLFPSGSIKLNGIKFYSERDPDMIVSYTASLMLKAGGSLVPVFEQLMRSRGVVANPVLNFRSYEEGGIGGEVCGESVLLGTSSFLESMGVTIPQGSMVSQAVYAAIDGQLCAVVAIAYSKMRSASAGMVTLCGYRKLTPVFLGGDFILTESFLRTKFEARTKRLKFPSPEDRAILSAKVPQEPLPCLALSTRPDLISAAYAVTGARALRTSSRLGVALHLFGGIVGLLSMTALAITGSAELLTPMNILLYQLVFLVPGFLLTEWARHV